MIDCDLAKGSPTRSFFSNKGSKLTWKAAESVRAVGNKWENRHRFKVLVSCEYSPRINGFKQVQIAYLAVT